MKDNDLEYDPTVLMAACVQAAARILVAQDPDKAGNPEAVARLAAQLRDEALLQM